MLPAPSPYLRTRGSLCVLNTIVKLWIQIIVSFLIWENCSDLQTTLQSRGRLKISNLSDSWMNCTTVAEQTELFFEWHYAWLGQPSKIGCLPYFHTRACLDHLTKLSMIVTSSTADRDQWSRSNSPRRSSYLSRPLCWQCDSSVDGRSPSVGRSPGLAEDSRKGVFLLAISGSLHSL